MTAVMPSRTASTPKIASAYCRRHRSRVVTAAGGVGTASGRRPTSVSRRDPPGGATSVVRSPARTTDSATVSPCSPCHVAMRRSSAQRGGSPTPEGSKSSQKGLVQPPAVVVRRQEPAVARGGQGRGGRVLGREDEVAVHRPGQRELDVERVYDVLGGRVVDRRDEIGHGGVIGERAERVPETL